MQRTSPKAELSQTPVVPIRAVCCNLLVFLAIVLLFTQVLMFVYVPTCSMAPTIQPGDLALNWRLGNMSRLERGTIISFHHERFAGDVQFMKEDALYKRIIGLPGETVRILGGSVWIDNQLLDESYLPEGTDTISLYNWMFTVPEGCYFVMGDNRAHSEDSRFWENPFVRSDQIQSYELVHLTVPGLSWMLAQNAYHTGSKLPAGAANPAVALLQAALSCPVFLVQALAFLFFACLALGALVYTLWTCRSLAGLLRSGEAGWAAFYATAPILSVLAIHKLALLYLIGG